MNAILREVAERRRRVGAACTVALALTTSGCGEGDCDEPETRCPDAFHIPTWCQSEGNCFFNGVLADCNRDGLSCKFTETGAFVVPIRGARARIRSMPYLRTVYVGGATSGLSAGRAWIDDVEGTLLTATNAPSADYHWDPLPLGATTLRIEIVQDPASVILMFDDLPCRDSQPVCGLQPVAEEAARREGLVVCSECLDLVPRDRTRRTGAVRLCDRCVLPEETAPHDDLEDTTGSASAAARRSAPRAVVAAALGAG